MSIQLIDTSYCDSLCKICNYDLFKYELENDLDIANHVIRKHYCIVKYDKSILMEKVKGKGSINNGPQFDNEMLMTCYYCEQCIKSALYLNYKEVFLPTDYSQHTKKFMLISEFETRLPKDITNTLIILIALIIEDEHKTENMRAALKSYK